MRLTIRTKLIGNLLLLILLMGVVGVISMTQFKVIEREAGLLHDEEVRALTALSQLQFNLALVRASAAVLPNMKEPQEVQKTVEMGHQYEQEALKALDSYMHAARSPEVRATVQQIEQASKAFLETKETTFQRALQGDMEGARQNATTVAKARFASLVTALNQGFSAADARAEKRHEAVEKTVETGRALNLGILLLATIIGLTGGLLLAGAIGRNLRTVAQAVERVAQGDLSQDLEIKSNDELGDMAKSVQHMILNLRAIVSKVHNAANSVAAGTEQISASTEQISQTAQSQASATDETSSSIAEIASSITMVATNVTSAKDVAIQAFDSAQLGRKTVSQTIEGMAKLSETIGEVTATIERLGQSSAQIGAIVELIGDIAKQTNLLALNATIEAARAGENGRGFAVVADEVRQLAKRSTEATGNISELIRGIQGEMARAVESTQQGEQALKGGTQLAHEAGQSLEAIVESVDQVRAWMEQIHRATQEQGMASDQIVHASEHLSTSTRESTQAIGQIADSATSLQGLGHELVGAIAFFATDTKEASVSKS